MTTKKTPAYLSKNPEFKTLIELVNKLDTFDTVSLAVKTKLPYGTVSGHLARWANEGYIEKSTEVRFGGGWFT